MSILFAQETAAGGIGSGAIDTPISGEFIQGGASYPFSLVRIHLTYAGAYFEGGLAGDGASIAGSWNQGGAAVPLTVEKQ